MAFTNSPIGYALGTVSPPPTSLRPATVVSNPGLWTTVGGVADVAAAMADETDTSYAQSPVSPVSAAVTVAPTAGVILDATQTIVSTRFRVSTGAPVSVLIELLEVVAGSPVLRSSRVATGALGWNPYEWTLSSAEHASITDRSKLQGRITAGV